MANGDIVHLKYFSYFLVLDIGVDLFQFYHCQIVLKPTGFVHPVAFDGFFKGLIGCPALYNPRS